VVTEIRIYVEGGGDGKNTKTPVRKGFSVFFHELISEARKKRINWRIIACGSRNTACTDFITAMKSHPDAFNVLLVDSESSVTLAPWEHLKNQDNWDLHKSHNEQYHLMVQVMESWLIADIETLKKFYGQDFNENKIPDNQNIEDISKATIEVSLKAATRNTQKGRYHKINHGPKILELVDTQKVRNAAPHCDRLFKKLSEKIGEAV